MAQWLEQWPWLEWKADRGRFLLACLLMLGASGLPWLADPLQGGCSPWQTPLVPAWSVAAPSTIGAALTSVGAGSFMAALLCLSCTLKPVARQDLWRYRLAGSACLLPLCLFLLHFIAVDTQQGDLLAYHKLEALLILRHLGYNLPRDWLPVTAPFALDKTALHWRAVLLVDQLRPGALLPLIGLSLWFPHQQPGPRRPDGKVRSRTGSRGRVWRPLWVTVVLGVGLLPALVAPLWSLLATYQAGLAIASGEYQQALERLETIRWLAPGAVDSVTYEEQLGQSFFGLEAYSQREAISFAAALSLLQQRAYLRAYQLLFPQWLAHTQRQQDPPEPWLTAALSEALEGLVEAAWPAGALSEDTLERNHRLSMARAWLRRLAQVNPDSLYAHYLLGRADYELRNYQDCLAEMGRASTLSADNDLRSSAYTYIGLAEIALGHSVQGREALLLALALDPDYHNNTAREALSGLH
ncbi:tetratricopeptide repeat protein [Thermogemmatispora carboxidivorans]|uniref:tetratricopeptide repeat protein n=1 Tax=Thermogemmatispora carboxidivorans TaxID=1382306 RepID=UPI00069B8C34|nr:tetratricopeptide repeat protein [Thermogemmatispora carboxidivorans]